MKKISIKLLLVPVLALLVMFNASGIASADFNKDSIIGDSVFDDKGTMTASQIDAFLNKFPHSCISTNRGFAAKKPTGYSYSTGYQFGDYVSAGSVIHAAAQAYDLNPQVLIVTLEKEQSLVSGRSNYSGYCNNGDEHKYAAAMGYGCPDSGGKYSYSGVSLYRRNGNVKSSTGTTCVNSKEKAGFSQQVIRAAWLLKFGQQRSLGNTNWAIVRGDWDNSDDLQSCYSGPMTRGNHRVCPSGSVIYYDGYRTIDGTKTFMGTGATASLYWYTPHFHGNELFVYFFENWFGSTIGSDLLRTTDSATVYLVSGDDKYPIADLATMNALYPLGKVKFVSSSYLASKTTKPTMKRLIKGSGSSLYFFDAGIKLSFNSCGMIEHYGMTCSDYTQVSDYQLSKFVNGPSMPQVMNTTSGKWFYMSGGAKREAASATALSSNGISTTSVRLHESSLANLPLGAPVVKTNTVVGVRGKSANSLISGQTKYDLPSGLVGLKFLKSFDGGKLDQASFNKLDTVSFNGYFTDGTSRYLLDDKGKVPISNHADFSSSYTALPTSLSNSVPTSSSSIAAGKFFKSPTSASVYRVSDRTKYPLASWNDLIMIDNTPEIVTIPEHYLAGMATGRLQFGPSSLIKTSSSASVYMIDGLNKKRAVSSFSVVNAAGISSKVSTVSQQVMDSYSTSPGLASHLIKCGAEYYIATNGSIRKISQPMRQEYGLSDENFIPYETETCSTLKKGADYTYRYARSTSDRSIYFVQEGAKRPFSSYAAYTAHGGRSSNTILLEGSLIGMIPVGDVL